MRLGRAVHTSVLEPDAFALTHTVWRGGVRRGKEWDAFTAANDDKDILTEDEYARCVAIRDAVRANPAAASLLKGAETEVTLTWTDTATGIACKARADIITRDGIVADLKTTTDIEPRAFSRTVANYKYHSQLAHYMNGVAARDGMVAGAVLIAVESEGPFDVCCYELDEDAVWVGQEEVAELLAKLKQCQETDSWPGRFDGVVPLALPAWCLDQIEEETK
jgi:hypothetical protein